MTIIGNDNFWLLWIIQLIFDVVILLAIILYHPTKEERRNGDNGDSSDPIAGRPDADRLRRSGEYGH